MSQKYDYEILSSENFFLLMSWSLEGVGWVPRVTSISRANFVHASAATTGCLATMISFPGFSSNASRKSLDFGCLTFKADNASLLNELMCDTVKNCGQWGVLEKKRPMLYGHFGNLSVLESAQKRRELKCPYRVKKVLLFSFLLFLFS